MPGHSGVPLGTVIEVRTGRGLRYLQLTHVHREMGHLLRVLPGVFQERPPLIASIANEKEEYFTFYSLEETMRHGLVRKVGVFDIPVEARSFPVFRDPRGLGPRSDVAWLWDGERSWKAESRDAHVLALPVKEIPNHRLLVARLEQDWRPGRPFKRVTAETFPDPQVGSAVRHFVYFVDARGADRFREAVESPRRTVAVSPAAGGGLLVMVSTPWGAQDTLRDAQGLEREAERFGGSYDGWEAEEAA